MSWRLSNLPNRTSGLTLIEMVVVVSIFMILTVVVLGNLPAFRNRLALDLLAEEVALVIRQAQVYGAATKVFGGEFPSHGVYLPVTGDSFILFADLDSDNIYDEGGDCGSQNTECREQFRLYGGVKIEDVFVCEESCTSSADYAGGINSVVIMFKRPGSDADFLAENGDPFFNVGHIKIKLYSEKNNESRGIAIWRTGHIYTCRNFDSC